MKEQEYEYEYEYRFPQYRNSYTMDDLKDCNNIEQKLDFLKQLFLRSHLFAEIQNMLTEDQFISFLRAFKMVKIKENTNYELKSHNLYYFLSGGTMVKILGSKDQISTSIKSSGKKKTMSHLMSATFDNKGTMMTESIKKGAHTSLEFLLENTKKVFGIFHAHERNTTVLKLNINDCEDIITIIRKHVANKIKFISKFPIFETMCTSQIQQHVQKFEFIKLVFNQTLYSQVTKPSHVFFIESGQIQLQSVNLERKLILQSPVMIGEIKNCEDEKAKCTTEKCTGYQILKTTLDLLLKKDESANNESQNESRMQKNGCLKRLKEFIAEENFEVTKKSFHFLSSSPKRNFQKMLKSAKFQNRNGSQSRKMKLREYFSNFLNEKYEEYSNKKSTEIDFDEQQPILYDMKPLTAKVPEYSKMNEQLRKIRIRKILERKSNVAKSNSSQQLLIFNNLNGGQEEINKPFFSNNQINCKIWRSLEAKIAVRIQKKNPYLGLKNIR